MVWFNSVEMNHFAHFHYSSKLAGYSPFFFNIALVVLIAVALIVVVVAVVVCFILSVRARTDAAYKTKEKHETL